VNRALWLLLKLRLKGWGRRLARQVQTVRGAIFTAVFGVMMLMWLGSLIVNAVIAQRVPGTTAPPEQVERFAPLVLLLYCVGVLASSGNQSPLQFTLPEVQFLFSGPFTRRQVLTYKLLSQLLLTLPIALFLSLALRNVAGMYLAGLVAAVLVFSFLQLYSTAVAMISSALDEWSYTRMRKIVLYAIFLTLGASAIFGWWQAGGTNDALATLKEMEATPIVQYGLLPFRWFARTLTSTSFDEHFFVNAGLSLAVNVFLLGLVYQLDAQYLESAAAAAERRYARIERMRRGGLAALTASKPGNVRYKLANPPWLGGVGPIVWRQIISAFRSRRVLGLLIFVTLMSSIGPVIAAVTNQKGMDDALPFTIAGMGLFMSVMLSHTLAFDFRSDVDRMEVLKGLPIPAWRIVVGQLLTPVLCISLYQILLLTVVYVTMGRVGLILVFALVLSWPINLLLTGIDNLFFLLFPTRMAPQTPGDFSNAGRQMIMLIGKGLGLMIGVGLPAAFGGITYAITGSLALTLLAALVPALAICALPIPLTTIAFIRYDVARDTPP
jgi:hypothetical protein